MKSKLFQGVIAYPITPFTKEETVNIPLYKSLVERLIKNKSNAIATLGSTGVLPYLSDQEKEDIVKATMEQVNGRVPVLVGVSNLTTAKTIQHARHAEKMGADAVMIIPMSYWKLTDDEVFEHYQSVAKEINIPIMAYNNPGTGGIDMSHKLLQRLLGISNITMIKESTGDIQRMHHLKKSQGDNVNFYNGSNTLALGAFAAGASGWCTALPNLIPEWNLKLFEATQKGDFKLAQQLFHKQLDVLKFVQEKGLPRTIKAGLDILGIESGYLRSPLNPLPYEEKKQLEVLLNDIME